MFAARYSNKPLDRRDAERMIRLQEGHDTEVVSGICLFRAGSYEWAGAVEVSVIRFRRLSDSERNEYLDSNRWEGRSGGYGLQDPDPFVEVIRGSYSNVVGLPLERLARLLQDYPALMRYAALGAGRAGAAGRLAAVLAAELRRAIADVAGSAD